MTLRFYGAPLQRGAEADREMMDREHMHGCFRYYPSLELEQAVAAIGAGFGVKYQPACSSALSRLC